MEYQHVDKDDPVHFSFVDEDGRVELEWNSEALPPGWSVIPLVSPCEVCKYIHIGLF